jgi:NTE family protein
MLRALFRAQIRPDILIGTSIGAINAAMVAVDPNPSVIDDLVQLWASPEMGEVYGDSVPRQMRRFATRNHLHSPAPLQRMLERHLGKNLTFADLKVPLHLIAASIERSAEHWFTTGPVLPAVIAAAAIPGLLPPIAIDGEHFIDGSIVRPSPVGRAIDLGATDVYVLQVGSMDKPLRPPQRPWEAATVALELARRARFGWELEAAPPGVRVHLLPGGDEGDESPWAYRNTAAVRHRVSAAYIASRDYLASLGL